MVPAWLRRRRPSGNALIAYVTLASFGTFNPDTGAYDECRPSLATMAEECGLLERTLQRGITELIGYGAVERTVVVDPIKGRQPSIYRVIFGHLEGPRQVTTEQIVNADAGEASQVTDPLTSETVTGDAREVSVLTLGRCQDRRGGGVTGDVEPRTPTTNNPETKKNTNTRERVHTEARDPLTSPAFLIDTPAPVGVLSGHTATSGDLARGHYDETRRVTTEIMAGYSEWLMGETGEELSKAEELKISNAVNGLLNDRPKGLDDAGMTKLRNAIVAGLGNWSRSNSFSVNQLPDFVLLAKRRTITPEAAPNKAQQRHEQNREVVRNVARSVAGMGRKFTKEDAEMLLQRASGLGVAVTEQRAIGGAL